MAEFDPGAQLTGAANYGNFLSKQDLEVRKTNAYNALAKVYGPMAGDPEAAQADASAEVATANAPNLIAANKAKADALTAAQGQFGPSAGNPDAQSQNLQNADTQGTAQRQAQVRGIQMLKSSIPEGADSVDPATFDRVVGQNAKTLGLTDPDQLAQFKAAVTAPGGATHLDSISQALMSPQTVVGAKPIVYGTDGKAYQVQTTKTGTTAMVPLGDVSQASVLNNNNNMPIKKENADTAKAKLPILQQNANTAAYSANTRSNNSNFGNPNGQASQGGSPTRANPGGQASSANTHVANADGTATTPTFDKLAPVGSKARATALGSAQQIVGQDITLQNANQVFGQALKQVPAGAGPSSLIKSLPGSVQADLNANLATIKSQEQMAWIASMKNASGQTGIGRVLQSEAKNAESLFGNLGQEQTVGQLQLHLNLAQRAINQLHSTAQAAFKAQWGQDPYALMGATPGGTSATTPVPANLKSAYAKYGITK